MRFRKLQEGKFTNNLYHFTTLPGIISILDSNSLRIQGDDSIDFNNKREVFSCLSFTRNRELGEYGTKAFTYGIEFDTDILTNSISTQPYAHFSDNNKNSHGDKLIKESLSGVFDAGGIYYIKFYNYGRIRIPKELYDLLISLISNYSVLREKYINDCSKRLKEYRDIESLSSYDATKYMNYMHFDKDEYIKKNKKYIKKWETGINMKSKFVPYSKEGVVGYSCESSDGDEDKLNGGICIDTLLNRQRIKMNRDLIPEFSINKNYKKDLDLISRYLSNIEDEYEEKVFIKPEQKTHYSKNNLYIDVENKLLCNISKAIVSILLPEDLYISYKNNNLENMSPREKKLINIINSKFPNVRVSKI